MKNKILIELRAAIDVSDNTFIPLCHVIKERNNMLMD